MRARLVLIFVLCVVTVDAAEIRLSIRGDPRSFDPLLAADDASEAVRYMTAGVLLRFDRVTHRLRPELAESWRVTDAGRRIHFVLRKGLQFSDGTPFDSADVAATIRRLNDRSLRSGIADTFRTGTAPIAIRTSGPDQITLSFTEAIAGLEGLFDHLAIQSSRSREPERATLGPYSVGEYKPGQFVLLKRNPRYWKQDAEGRQLPYADSIRLLILASRDTELLRFRRGELDALDKLEPETYERLSAQNAAVVRDLGPSLDSEVLWFNQVPNAPVSAHKRAWFGSARFRRAISAAISREDLVRIAFRGFARPAAAYVSESNRPWWHSGLKPHSFNRAQALALLREDGFQLAAGKLTDRAGNPVEFSLITNSSSKSRMQIASMLQSDLSQIGIVLNIVPLEFGSLIERITQTNLYEACLLGLTNVEPDPNTQVNVFLSSGNLHAWHPAQRAPATAWEAEIDRLVQKQAGASQQVRKESMDRIQEIVWREAPILFLVHPNVLVAVSSEMANVAPSPLPPRIYWNIEWLRKAAQ